MITFLVQEDGRLGLAHTAIVAIVNDINTDKILSIVHDKVIPHLSQSLMFVF
jgi:hypothetical protein